MRSQSAEESQSKAPALQGHNPLKFMNPFVVNKLINLIYLVNPRSTHPHESLFKNELLPVNFRDLKSPTKKSKFLQHEEEATFHNHLPAFAKRPLQLFERKATPLMGNRTPFIKKRKIPYSKKKIPKIPTLNLLTLQSYQLKNHQLSPLSPLSLKSKYPFSFLFLLLS